MRSPEAPESSPAWLVEERKRDASGLPLVRLPFAARASDCPSRRSRAGAGAGADVLAHSNVGHEFVSSSPKERRYPLAAKKSACSGKSFPLPPLPPPLLPDAKKTVHLA